MYLKKGLVRRNGKYPTSLDNHSIYHHPSNDVLLHMYCICTKGMNEESPEVCCVLVLGTGSCVLNNDVYLKKGLVWRNGE